MFLDVGHMRLAVRVLLLHLGVVQQRDALSRLRGEPDTWQRYWYNQNLGWVMTGLGMENERTGTDRTRNCFVYKIYTMFRLWMRRAIKKSAGVCTDRSSMRKAGLASQMHIFGTICSLCIGWKTIVAHA